MQKEHMPVFIPSSTLEKFTTFGDLLRFLRRRVGMTQIELASAVGYSDTQISRLEQNERLPDVPTVASSFVPALGLEEEPKVVARLLELAASVRREDAPTLGLCPYKGLNYFDETDADLFAGREGLTTRLVERILSLNGSPHETRFLAIVGASGSGKSSLVRAGIVSALRWNKISTNWHIHIFTPTAHPLESLAAALTNEEGSVATILRNDLAHNDSSLQLFARRKLGSKKESHLLLVVDQFEELFALCRSEEERASFIGNLLVAASDANSPVSVVITLRADFYAHCAEYMQLRESLAKSQEYIGAMSQEELQRAIEEPARRGRWEFEPGLVDLLLHEVGHEPGALPLLSHALLETWQRRRGRTMTLSGYASSGGVRGAIAETAETVFTDQFTPQQQTIAKRIFLRLTELSDETISADTRRRATFNELILKPEEAVATHAVLKALADARLITTSENSAEVAHEALIREWPTLRSWLEQNRESLRLHRQLTEAALEWLAVKREPEMLYRGLRLAQAREWAAFYVEELNALEAEFLTASIDSSERESAEREAQRQRELDLQTQRAEEQTQAAIKLGRRAMFLTGTLILAGALAVTTFLFAQQANWASRLSASRELAAAAISNLEVDQQLSILLALESVSMTYAADHTILPEAEGALQQAVQASHLQLALSHLGHSVYGVTFSADGTRLATASADGTANVWDAKTGQRLLTLSGHTEAVNEVTFNPAGTRIATVSSDGTAKVWDAATGKLLLTFPDHDFIVSSIDFNSDGTQLATASADGKVFVWQAETGKVLHNLFAHTGAVKQVTFSPDGTRLATIGDDGRIKLWNAKTGQLLLTYPGAGHSYGSLTFSPEGNRLAVGEPTVKILDPVTGELLYSLCCHTKPVLSIAFSPDGTRIATSGGEGAAVKLWNVETRQELLTLSGHTGLVQSIAFSPDGSRLATASDDGTAKVWKIPVGGELLTLLRNSGTLNAIAFNSNGTRLATAGADRTVKVWDAASGQLLLTLLGHTAPVQGIVFSPDGTQLATASGDKTAKIWDVSSGKELLTLRGHTGPINSVIFSPDAKRLATASNDKTAVVWDAATGDQLLTLSGHIGSVNAVVFDTQGTHLATVSEDGRVKIWTADTGQVLLTLPVHSRTIQSLAFSPDGTRLATADKTVEVWELSTGKVLLTLSGHKQAILGIGYGSDGTRLATVSSDGTVKVWDAMSGQERFTLSGHMRTVNRVVFQPDGNLLFTISDEGLRSYALRIDDLIELARARLTRSLTTEECQKYLHVEECPDER